MDVGFGCPDVAVGLGPTFVGRGFTPPVWSGGPPCDLVGFTQGGRDLDLEKDSNIK